MKKLLFLAGLIMVAAACSSGIDSGTVNTNDETNSNCNLSFIISGKDGSGLACFDLCTAAYDETTQTLNLSLSSGKTYSYKKELIRDEYMPQVRDNKVTMILCLGKTFPAVVEKDKPQSFKTVEFDTRQFVFNSILKDDLGSGVTPYTNLYMGLFLKGFSKAGNKMMKDGRFFFSDNDFIPEKTGDEFQSYGRYSAGFGYIASDKDVMCRDRYGHKCNFMMCQARYEDNQLIIRMENGETYSYPIELFYNPYVREAITFKPKFMVSAVQLSNGNWIPAFLSERGGTFGYSELIPYSQDFYGILSKKFEMDAYIAYMEKRGVQNLIGEKLVELFFDLQ